MIVRPATCLFSLIHITSAYIQGDPVWYETNKDFVIYGNCKFVSLTTVPNIALLHTPRIHLWSLPQ
jgi:hypothetical protein